MARRVAVPGTGRADDGRRRPNARGGVLDSAGCLRRSSCRFLSPGKKGCDVHRVYSTHDLSEAVLLKDHLLHNGIDARVRSKNVSRAPLLGVHSEVWVAGDADSDEVATLIRDFVGRRDTPARAKRSWRCRRCREENPGEFEFCWNCRK